MLEKGMWKVGAVTVRLKPAKTQRETGHTRTVATWVNVADGKMLGYTLDDVAATTKARGI
jgi:hypothetical protein